MRPTIATLLVCCVLPLLAACGSGGSSSGTARSGAAPTTTHTGSLKLQTTPKFGAPAASAPVLSGSVQIAYRNIAINPDIVKVKAGSTIRWTNYDSTEHNVTSAGGAQSFKSGNLGEGATFEVTVTGPGVIHYLCTIHPASMNGTIEVVP